MNYIQSVVLGVVQGITEFLPISSSAHLILVPRLFGWPDPGLAFDVALHWGTLLGVVAYFFKDMASLAGGLAGSLRGKREFNNRLPWYLVAATIPGAVLGFVFEKSAETVFRSPWIIAGTLSGVGLLLWVADRRRAERLSLDQITLGKAILIGVTQGLAVVPGVSRSGITIATALLLGFDRVSAARYSFLLSIPIIFGAGILKAKYLVSNAHNPYLWTGLVASAVSGLLAIHFLFTYVKSRSFTPFVIYRLALAAAIVGAMAIPSATAAPLNTHPYRVSPELDEKIRLGLHKLYNQEFDEAHQIFGEIKNDAAEHPMIAFGVASADWWRLSTLVLENDSQESEAFLKSVEVCITLSKAKIDRGDPTGEGYLTLGGAYGLKGRWEATNRNWMTAYFKGRSAQKYLGKALQANRDLEDAKMGLGIYNYFVATLPKVVRVLGFLGNRGDAELGLRQLEDAAAKGIYARTPAQLFLVDIYSQRQEVERSLEYLASLRKEFPESPFMNMLNIIVLYNAGRVEEMGREVKSFNDQVASGRFPKSFFSQGRFALALVSFKKKDWPSAVATLSEGINAEPSLGPWQTWSYLFRGYAYDAMGKRQEAIADYKRVLDLRRRWGSHDHAKERLDDPFLGNDEDVKKLSL